MLAYTSHNETSGLPILEAMACGCPVVTSQVSSVPEIAGGAAIRRSRLHRRGTGGRGGTGPRPAARYEVPPGEFT
ncbi:MAG: glycosyltransferase [Streptosporangiaceae bacterium]